MSKRKDSNKESNKDSKKIRKNRLIDIPGNDNDNGNDPGNDNYKDVELGEEDLIDYYNELLRQLEPREFVTISKSVETIADLIEIGQMYDPIRDFDKDYNIDIRTLYRLIQPLTDLQNMIGMKCIKEDIVDHILFTIQKFDENHETMMHTVIEGPPGTGKTEVAKIIGKIYLEMGILRNNKFIKATRSDLIAGYLGQTAIATQRIIDSAAGGVLFIDEVYKLVDN